MPFGSSAYKTDTQVRAAIKAMISSISGSGDWMDHWGQTPSWMTRRGGQGKPWWNIRRASVEERWPDRAINDFQGPEVIQETRYQLELKYPWSLKPPSEPGFEALVDAVLAKFRSAINLNGQVWEASLLSCSGGETGFVLVRWGDDALTAHLARFDLTVTQIIPRSP